MKLYRFVRIVQQKYNWDDDTKERILEVILILVFTIMFMFALSGIKIF
jgi:hypothetical protein